MILSILLPCNARYHKVFGAQLWFFYKQLSDFRGDLEHLTFTGWEKNLIHPDSLPEDCWEKAPATLEKLEYSIPDNNTVAAQNIINIDQKLFADLEEKFKSNNLVWKYLMTSTHEPLMQFLRETIAEISKKEPVEAMLLSCNLPSADHVGRELGIPVIHTEIGPTRKPQYQQTAYWDLSGVNGNTEAARRFEKSKDQLSSNLLSNRELLALFMSKEEVQRTDSIEENIDYETGIAGQVDDDSNIIAYSKGFNNQELQQFVNFHFGEENVLFRSHPAAKSYFTSRLDRSPSTLHFFKRIKQLVTINSSMALEASLFDKPVMVMGDSPFSILSDDLLSGKIAEDGHINELNFLYLNYIIPYELMFNYEYYKWRLSFPSEQEIREYHLNFYLKKKGFSSLEEFRKSIPPKAASEAVAHENKVLDVKAHDIPDLLLHEQELVKWCQMQADAITHLEEKCRKLELISENKIAVQQETLPVKESFAPVQETPAPALTINSEEELIKLAEKYFSRELEFIAQLAPDALPRSSKKISTVAVFYFRMHTGGVERTISNLLVKLNAMGYKTVLLTDEEPGENCYNIPEQTKIKVFSSGRLRTAEADCIASRIREWKEFISEENIDIVLYNDSLEQHAIWDLCAAKLAGAHFIMQTHEYCAMDMFSLTKFTALRTWKFADGLVTLSRVDHAWWKTLGCNAKYIPNILTAETEAAPREKTQNCDILWVGRISPEKAPLDAVFALEEVVKEIPDARLIIAGCPETPDDPVYTALLKTIDEKNLKDHVVLAGFVKDIASCYQSAALYISTSKAECFPLTLFEAKANALAVLSYELPNIELFRRTAGHIQVAQGDWKSLARETVRLLKSPELAERLGREGKETLACFVDHPFEKEWKAVFEATEKNLPLDDTTPEAEDISIALKSIMRDGEDIFIDLFNGSRELSDKLVFETAYYQKLLAERDKDIENYRKANQYNEQDAKTLALKLASETAHYQKLLDERDKDIENYRDASEYNEKEAKSLAQKLASETAHYQKLISERDVDIENYRKASEYNEKEAKTFREACEYNEKEAKYFREAYEYNVKRAEMAEEKLSADARLFEERAKQYENNIAEREAQLSQVNQQLESLKQELAKTQAALKSSNETNQQLEEERKNFAVKAALKLNNVFKKRS
ncbi:MAG: glycosyltransferase [Lentisphaeria bacterium]|nr:glycosyltransferase [Lentisphaeria bacterium]